MNFHNAVQQESGDRYRQSVRERGGIFSDDPKQYLLALFPILMWVPWNPMLSANTYESQIHLAHSSGLQYGREILATYGPLGFLGIPFYSRATFPILLAFNVVLYGLLIARLRAVSRGLGDGRFGLMACLVFLPTTIWNPNEWAPVLFAPYYLTLIYCFENVSSGWKLGWQAATIYAVSFAVFTLMKLTFAPFILIAILFCSLSEMWHGSIPKGAAIYAASLVVLWVSSGQSVSNGGAFLASSSQIVAGYKDGVGIWDFRVMASAVPLIIADAALWLAATVAAWRIGRWAGVVVSAVLILIQYALFLNGYIRADVSHALPCIFTTLGLWALLNPLIKTAVPHRWRWVAVGSRWSVVPILMALVIAVLSSDQRLDFSQIAARPRGFVRLILRGAGPLKAKAVAMEESLRGHAVPGMEGVDADVPSSDFGIATVSGATLRLRPTITSYSAYTSQLARANADYIESDHGPKAILLRYPYAIDGKYPTIEDTFAWISLLSHYRHARTAGDYDLFERRAAPRVARLVPLSSRTFALGEEVVVPRDGSRPIWAEISISPNIAGRLIGSAFKPIPIYLSASLEDGTERKDRIILCMAKSGFLLSPYLADAETIRTLAGDDEDGWQRRTVKALKIESRSLQTILNINRFYETKIEARFFALYLESVP